MTKLSVAMIVKNEERHLPRCLKSIADIWDQLVIVDTGSVDQTVKIAKDFGAEVHYHAWEDNFAKHRNQSFSYATGDWILQIDADEELVFLDNRLPHVITQFLSQVPKDIHAVGLPMDDIVKGRSVATTQMVRIFRRGKVKYKRRIHNEPMFKGLVGLLSLAKLNHYGYDLDDEERIVKAERTIGLLKQALADDPKDYDSMFYIAQAYGTYTYRIAESIKWGEKYAKKRNKMGEKFNKSIFYFLIISYMKVEQREKCWYWLQIGMQENPNDLDISMAMIRFGIWNKNLDLLGAGARGFVTLYNDFDKNRIATASKFVFNYNENSYLFALYHLTMTYLQHAGNHVYQLQESLKSADSKMSNTLTGGLHRWLKENEAIFKHNDSLLQASETAAALFGLNQGTNEPGLRADIDQRRDGQRIILR